MDGIYDALTPSSNVARACSIWCEAEEDLDYTAERYLRGLGAQPPWPSSLRYMAECYHGPAGVATPALIAKIVDINGALTGIQRVYLDDDGDLAEVVPRRLLLGECAGNAVHFGGPRPGEVLIVTETLDQALRMHYRRGCAAWAALSAAGIQRLILPAIATDILIMPTSDAGCRAAAKAAQRWRAEGHSVRVFDEHQERDHAVQRRIAERLAGHVAEGR